MTRSEVAEPTAATSTPRVSTVVLWFALAGGMVSWMVHLVVGSALVPATCEHGIPWVIDALTVITGVVCIAAALVAWRILRRFRGSADPRTEGYRVLGFLALIVNVGSLVLVIGEGLMHVWVGVCR